MPSAFPGMDLHLEMPNLSPDSHHEIISQLRTELNPALRPHYVARVGLSILVLDEDDTGRAVVVPIDYRCPPEPPLPPRRCGVGLKTNARA